MQSFQTKTVIDNGESGRSEYAAADGSWVGKDVGLREASELGVPWY